MMKRPPSRIEGDLVFIPLSQDQWAKVDMEVYQSIPTLGSEPWCAQWYESSHTFYALRMAEGSTLYMHRLISGCPAGMDVNHRNHDGLDNTRLNLEVCTRAQNIQYKRKYLVRSGKPTESRYKGVRRSYNSKINPWVATISTKHLGQFPTEEAAAEAYNRAAAEKFGHYAKLNEIDPVQIE